MLIRIFLIGLFALAMWMTWKRRRQRAMSLTASLAWAAIWAGGIAITFVPRIAERLAAVAGVGRGADLALYVAVALQFFLLFKLAVDHTRLERTLTDLVRRDALRDLPDQI